MGAYRRYGVTLTLFSCVIWLFVNYWSFLTVGRLSTSPINKRQTWAGQTITSNEDKYSIFKDRMSNSEVKSNNEKEKEAFNVTDIVLRELQRGFFAAINDNKHISSGDTVCISEPTILDCGNAGFAALLLATLDHLSYCDMLGIQNVSIKWNNCQTICTRNPRINSWPVYFEPLKSGIELNARRVLCLGGIIAGPVLTQELVRTVKRLSTKQIQQSNWASRTSSLLEVGFRKRQSLPGYEKGSLITSKLRLWVKDMITKYIRPNKRIEFRVDKFYRNNMEGFNVVGVHIRGTDHWIEMEEQTLPEIEQWINDTQVIFQTLEEPKKIFIASDNDESVQRFVEHFGKNKVAFTAAKRAQAYHSDKPVHGHSVATNDPIKIGSQVLIDILLLAKCGHFLHGESSVASLASFFNPQMKLFFVGHLEDDTVNNDSIENRLLDPSGEITEVEWEEDWNKELETLTQCYEQNSPYSACPSMARGDIIDPRDVRKILGQSH